MKKLFAISLILFLSLGWFCLMVMGVLSYYVLGGWLNNQNDFSLY